MAKKTKTTTVQLIAEGKKWEVLQGDVEEVCRGLAPDSFDAVLCDPPYGISFLGKAWDYQVPKAPLWGQVLRVMKPGAPLIAFSATRTYHRAAVEIEDAGFEIRDMLSWLYGQGYPKGSNVASDVDDALGTPSEIVGLKVGPGLGRSSGNGLDFYPNRTDKNKKGMKRRLDGMPNQLEQGFPAGTAPIREPSSAEAKAWKDYHTGLKPALEPAVLARKPLDGTVAENVLKWGVGGLAIGKSRIGVSGGGTNCPHWPEPCRGHKTAGGAYDSNHGEPPPGWPNVSTGRWPSNVIVDAEAAAEIDRQSGDRPSTLTGRAAAAAAHTNPGETDGSSLFGAGSSAVYADSGGLSRIFYVAKPSVKEKGSRNDHPTVKPIALMQRIAQEVREDMLGYWARLMQPPRHGRILVPFCGSGSEMLGCMMAGWTDVVGIELDPKNADLCRWRLENARVRQTYVTIEGKAP